MDSPPKSHFDIAQCDAQRGGLEDMNLARRTVSLPNCSIQAVRRSEGGLKILV